MKKIIFLLSVLFTIISCSNDDKPKSFILDNNAKVYIKPITKGQKLSFSSKTSATHLTPLEIVKRATTMRFYNFNVTNSDIASGFAGKDTLSAVPAFLKYGFEIINVDGVGKPYVDPLFIGAQDCVIEIFRSNKDIDTIAYIPNSVFIEAKLKIENALARQDTTAVYEAFKNSFTFIPITGAEYRELKRQGLN